MFISVSISTAQAVYPLSQSPAGCFGFNGCSLLYEYFSPKLKLTNSNIQSAAISKASARNMILKCPEDLRFTPPDMR